MAATLNITQSDQDLKDQMQEILLEEGGHCIGLLLYLYRNNPRVICLLREVSWGWTTDHLRPGVMEELGDPYSLPAGTKCCYRIRTISDSAGPYSGLLLAFERRVICLLREVSWGWTMVHLRPGVMEELGDPYSLPAGTKCRYRIRTISDSAGPRKPSNASFAGSQDGGWEA